MVLIVIRAQVTKQASVFQAAGFTALAALAVLSGCSSVGNSQATAVGASHGSTWVAPPPARCEAPAGEVLEYWREAQDERLLAMKTLVSRLISSHDTHPLSHEPPTRGSTPRTWSNGMALRLRHCAPLGSPLIVRNARSPATRTRTVRAGSAERYPCRKRVPGRLSQERPTTRNLRSISIPIRHLSPLKTTLRGTLPARLSPSQAASRGTGPRAR